MSDESYYNPSTGEDVSIEDIPVASQEDRDYLSSGTTPAGTQPQVDTSTQTPGYNPNYNYDAAITDGLALIEPLNNASILNFDTPGVAVGLDAASQARSEAGIGSKLWDSTKDILGAKGDSVGAMLLAMALKGVGNLGTQKQANRGLDIQQGHLDLARQKQNNAQTSMHGVTVNMKAKPFAPLSGTGMINTGRV